MCPKTVWVARKPISFRNKSLLGKDHWQEIGKWKQKKRKHTRKIKRLLKWSNEFFGALDFGCWAVAHGWGEACRSMVTFLSMKKVTCISWQNLSFANNSCIKRSCARSRAATDPGERHGARQMRVHADQNNVHSIPLYTCMLVLRAILIA